MDCQNCGTEVPAEWIAIINNLHLMGDQISFVLKCKECGESVMDDNVLQLLGGLSSFVSKENCTAQEIMSWILSTYKIEKAKEGEKAGFRGKMTMLASGAVHEDEKQQRLAEFLNRANASPNLVGKTRKDLINENPNSSKATEVTLEEDAEGLIDVGEQYKDPNMNDIDISQYEDPTMMQLPDDEGMPPALRVLLERNMDRQIRARDNVTSGIRTNPNGFSRE